MAGGRGKGVRGLRGVEVGGEAGDGDGDGDWGLTQTSPPEKVPMEVPGMEGLAGAGGVGDGHGHFGRILGYFVRGGCGMMRVGYR